MPITHDNYDQLKIDKLKHYLEDMTAKGHAKPYEIFVDSLKVVPKTEDPKEFDNYEYYMNDDTEKIRIQIYNSNLSPRNDQYCFYVKQHKQDKGLNGLGDIENIIQEKLTARDKEHEAKRIQEELVETKQKLEDAEEYIEELEEKLEQSTSDKHKLKNIDLVELGSAVLGKLAEKNADVLSGMGLTGFGNKETKQLEQPQPQGEATFQKKAAEPDPLTEEQQQYIATLQQLQARFDEQQMVAVIGILNQLMEDPSHVNTVAELLNIKIT
jgi:hypothetical protein